MPIKDGLRLGVLALLLCACSGPETPQTATANAAPLTEARALEIARAAVAENDTWLENAEFETPKLRADGTWAILVWRLPKTPGGHRLIIIDHTGTVTEYLPGA